MSRSRAYPAIDLREATEVLKRLVSALDFKPGTREEIAKALRHRSGSSGVAARKIAALAHFGLLERREKLYWPTDLARHICDPPSEERLRPALRRAFLEVSLFREIVDSYQERGSVPSSLGEVFQRKGVTLSAKDEVARIFMASAEFAGALAADGVFKMEEVPTVSAPSSDQATKPAAAIRTEPSPTVAGREGYDVLRFPVTDRRPVEIWYPLGLNEKDLNLIKMQVGYLEQQVELSRPAPPIAWRGKRSAPTG